MVLHQHEFLLTAVLFLLFLPAAGLAQDKQAQELNVTGKLTRVMAIGGESSGWAIELDPQIPIEGKQMASLEITYPKTKKLEKFENHYVDATGTVVHRHGAESGDRLVLEVSFLRKSKKFAPQK
jgi:hypothetical protein